MTKSQRYFCRDQLARTPAHAPKHSYPHPRAQKAHAHTYLQAVKDPVGVVGVVAQEEHVVVQVGIVVHVGIGVVHDRMQQLPVADTHSVGWLGLGETEGERESGDVNGRYSED